MSEPTRQITADWVFPVDNPPIPGGVVEVTGARITAVHTGPPSVDALMINNAAIIPGLVNAHVHLEFSDREEPLAAGASFAEWIRDVIADRLDRDSHHQQSVRRGLAECAAAGNTTIGEIATDGWSPNVFTAETPRVVAFRELLALEPLALGDQLRIARDHLRAGREATPHWSAGLSPHAPYTVHPDLFHELCDLSAAEQAPVAFHLAETQEELELLRDRSGPLRDFFREIQFWRYGVIPPGSRPRDYLAAMCRVPHALLIHGNYLTDEDIDFLSGKTNFTVVYCPRTHHHFGHPPHPWRTMLDRGVRVALGTDGRATNPDLSLWNEVLFLRERFPDVAPEVLLRIATQNGAEALGLAQLTGSIARGNAADLAVIRLGDDTGNPYAQLIHAESRPVATMRDGKWIYR
jgi:cytosine/adenosine deaminase-related metal-dependent hydrolase